MRERIGMFLKLIVSVVLVAVSFDRFGGARRDRTDDLMLAKHALSQLSYGPYWFVKRGLPGVARGNQPVFALWASPGRLAPLARRVAWWARDELNVRPHAYQACALTT